MSFGHSRAVEWVATVRQCDAVLSSQWIDRSDFLFTWELSMRYGSLSVALYSDYLSPGLPVFLVLSISKTGIVCMLSLAEADFKLRPDYLQNLGSLLHSRLSCWFEVGEWENWKWGEKEGQERKWREVACPRLFSSLHLFGKQDPNGCSIWWLMRWFSSLLDWRIFPSLRFSFLLWETRVTSVALLILVTRWSYSAWQHMDAQ